MQIPRTVFSLLLGVGLTVQGHAAEPLKLVTGEYAPFTGENLPAGGPLAEIVRRAFTQSGTDLRIIFLPWKRGYADTLEGRYDGSFPYVRNAEREQDFYFSDAYYSVDRRMYYRADSAIRPEQLTSLQGKRYCVPLGFVVFNELRAMVDSHAITVQSPPDLASCARMLALNRIDFFITSPDIAEIAMAQAGTHEAVPNKSMGKTDYHLMVAKNHPRAADILATFNKGLANLKTRGEWQQVLKDAKL